MSRRIASVPGVVLIIVAASMWGLDGLIRKPLASSTSATTIVFGEHVVLVACVLPLVLPALRSLWRAGARAVAAGVAIGAGASALATILFTEAILHGDFITVIVLQKAQPLVAVLGAAVVLGEKPRRGFAWFLLPALAGIWLMALPHPLAPHAHGLTPIVETLAAAVLWGLGTVFGRYLSRELPFEQVTTIRFVFGLVASACALPMVGAAALASAHDSFFIIVLALVTGVFALFLYYYGLHRTPALLSAIGELAYPLTAALIGIYVFDSSLRWTQWVGVALTVGVVSLLPARRRAIVRTPDLVPSPAAS